MLVVWNGHAFELVVGFQRALAMLRYRAEIGFKTIRALRIPPEKAASARLAENFVRDNPTTYELSEYFSNLQQGRNVETPMTVPEIAAVVGKSVDYVRNLIRFFRELPQDAKHAWAEDRDRRFTFRDLNDLVRLVHQHDDAGARQKLERILLKKKREAKSSPPLPCRTAEECLEASLKGCILGDDAPKTRRSRRTSTHGMSFKEIAALEARFAHCDGHPRSRGPRSSARARRQGRASEGQRPRRHDRRGHRP